MSAVLDKQRYVQREVQSEVASRGIGASVGSIILYSLFLWLNPWVGREYALTLAILLFVISVLRFLSSKRRLTMCIADSSLKSCKYFDLVTGVLVVGQALVWALSLRGSMAMHDQHEIVAFTNIFFMAGLTASASMSLAPTPRLLVAFCSIVLIVPAMSLFTHVGMDESAGFGSVLVLYFLYLLKQSSDHRKILYERVDTHYTLLHKNDHIQKIIDSVPGLICIFSPEGNHLFSNVKARGFLSEGAENVNIDFFSKLDGFKKSGSREFSEELKMDVLRDDELQAEWHLVMMSRLDDNDIMTVAINIHEQKLIEKKLEEESKHRDQAAKFSVVGEMVGGIAHEINNPLAIIMGYSSKLKRMAKSGQPLEPEALHELGEKVYATVERVAKIVRALKVIARDDEGGDPEWSSLPRLVDEMQTLSGKRLEHAGVSLICKSIPPIEINCYPMQMVLALMNLVSNAKDALEDSETKEIYLSFEETDNQNFCIAVRDTGDGISPEIADKVMNPFFTTKAPGSGTGMGLSLTKTYIDAIEGKFFLRSMKPAEFVIEIPSNRIK